MNYILNKIRHGWLASNIYHIYGPLWTKIETIDIGLTYRCNTLDSHIVNGQNGSPPNQIPFATFWFDSLLGVHQIKIAFLNFEECRSSVEVRRRRSL